MGVSKHKGGPPKWMVKIREKPIKMDDLEENPLFLETPYIIPCYLLSSSMTALPKHSILWNSSSL